MKVGLPGVGIGGVFYILLVAMMPLRELSLTLRGQSNPQRWRRVGLQTSLAVLILLALGAEWWALARLPDLFSQAAQTIGLATALPGGGAASAIPVEEADVRLEYLAPTLAAAPFVIIAFLMGLVHALRFFLCRRPLGTPPVMPSGAQEEPA
jgi:hypothetical protein